MEREYHIFLQWILGVATLFASLLFLLHISEGERAVELLQNARPRWLAGALFLQLSTYVVQGEMWRIISSKDQVQGRINSIRLTLAKLFVDQALPSGGVSGTAFVSQALQRQGGSARQLLSGAILSIVAFHLAFGFALLVAYPVALIEALPKPLALLTLSRAVLSLAIAVAIWGLANRGGWEPKRFAWLANATRLLRAPLTGQWRRCLRLLELQLLTVVLDFLTFWGCLSALGESRPPLQILPGYLSSMVMKHLSFIPGGFGVFEAASTAAHVAIGLQVDTALSATILFRVLTYWLPMVPGFFAARTLRDSYKRASTAVERYWTRSVVELCSLLNTSPQGLSSREAARRIAHDRTQQKIAPSPLLKPARQIAKNPLLMLLLFASGASALSGEWWDSSIVFSIVVGSVLLSGWKEASAEAALRALRSSVEHKATVLRDGQPSRIPVGEVVAGDVVKLSAGSIIPADGVLIETNELFVDESPLTGESFPREKREGAIADEAPPAARSNCVFAGSTVRTGMGRYVVVATGAETVFGEIARRLESKPPPTEFERETERFGYLVLSFMGALTLAIFFLNVEQGRPALETLLFSVALAVGLSPELLPAILTMNIARGAKVMAKEGVLVRHLNAIENLGAIDILCTDKTGTLTEGGVQLEGAYSPDGERSEEVLRLCTVNAFHQSGIENPLDAAILAASPNKEELSTTVKRGEVPYDFHRKRLSVVVERQGALLMITKGAFHSVLSCCAPSDDHAELYRLYEHWSKRGTRVLAVGCRRVDPKARFSDEDERDLSFVGFLTFLDRAKKGAKEAIQQLKQLGIAVKVISGDNALVSVQLAEEVGLEGLRVMTGEQLRGLSGEGLWSAVTETTLFAEVDPGQKEDIVIALKRRGHVVGFLGDGINDAPAMHAADASVSVDTAVDVAKATADFVLLRKDLDLLRRGVEEGRKTFVNTMKYLLLTMSANLGNTLSMALSSIVLPFLPLLPGQILLNNFLSDVPALSLSGDRVDEEEIRFPERWNMRYVAQFMAVFGGISSLFDLITLSGLVWLFGESAPAVRTGWFLESLLSELVILFIIRTRRPIFKSSPSRVLVVCSLAVAFLGGGIVASQFGGRFGFSPPTGGMLLFVILAVVCYGAASEAVKRRFAPVSPARLRRR